MALYTFGDLLAMYFEDEQVWSLYCLQNLPMSYMTSTQFSATFILTYAKAACNMVVSLSSAALSVWGLRRADKMKKATANESIRGAGGKEAAITLVYLNILVGLQFLLLILLLVVKKNFPDQDTMMNYVYFLAFPFSNTLISAVNPLIYIVRSSKIRQELLKRGPSRVSNAGFSGNTALSHIKSKV
jgi:hypothetical protein